VITKIKGELLEVSENEAVIQVDAISYALLIPASDLSTLLNQVGNSIEFHTIYYMEGQVQGNVLTPRLIGFSTKRDRSFFELFTTVKGIGNRKALRALVRPFMETASAIAKRDIDALVELPEIGKRSAETIIAQLHGKVDAFVGEVASTIEVQTLPFCDDAIEMLVQLGESKRDAKQLVKKAIHQDPNIESADQLVQASFQIKGTT